MMQGGRSLSSRLPEKRSLNSSMLPPAKRSKPNNDVTQFGESWNNLWSSQCSQIGSTSPNEIPNSNTTSPSNIQPKQLPKKVEQTKQTPVNTIKPQSNHKTVNKDVSLPSPSKGNRIPLKSLSPSKLPLKTSQTNVKKSTKITPTIPKQIQQTPKPINKLPVKKIDEQDKPKLTTNSNKFLNDSVDMFDDFDIDSLPIEMQNSLLGKDKDTTNNEETLNDKKNEKEEQIPFKSLKETIMSSPSYKIQSNRIIHSPSCSPPENTTNMSIDKEEKQDDEIKLNETPLSPKIQERTSYVSKFLNDTSSRRPTQDNPIFEDIDSSPECSNGVKKDTNQDIRLIEKYNIQNKRLQMIVDILSKDDSSIREEVNISNFPASKIEELQKKIKRLEKDKLKYRAEYKKSEEERTRLFKELRHSIKRQEELSVKYEQEKKQVKQLTAQNHRYTEKVKALIALSQNLKETLSFNEKRITSLQSKLEANGRTSKDKSRRKSEPASKIIEEVKTSKNSSFQKSLSEGNCTLAESIPSKDINNTNTIVQPNTHQQTTDLFSAMEKFISSQGSENKQLLVSWLNAQIDDVNADPCFQEETTKQAFAKLESGLD